MKQAVVGTPSLVQGDCCTASLHSRSIAYESLTDLSHLVPLLLADIKELRNVGE